METVVDLSRIEADMVESMGGKSVNLGVMIAAGLPVPDGFVVTTAAYTRTVGEAVQPLLSGLDPASDEPLGAVAEHIRHRVLEVPFPDELRAEIVARYLDLGPDVPVAVRSSATAEDLAYASFAGQQDTYLNVVGDAALIDAVRRCWASLWTERAVAYRRSHDIDPAGVALAVVVQRMVDAEVAGVLFTANPVTGTRRESVIDASPGLGEAVVSGAVNPDHFVVDGEARRVVERRLGDKQIIITSRPGGGTDRRPIGVLGSDPCLTDEQLYALVDLGRRVQDHFGRPQDIEWALSADGRFWLTQTRAVTTLYPLIRSELPGERIFLCMTLAQGLTRPITPAGLATFRAIGASVRAVARPDLDASSDLQVFQVAGQRVFVDVTGVVGNPLGRRLAAAAFGVMEARTATVLATLTTGPRFALTTRSPLAVLAPVVRVAVVRARLPVRIAASLVSPRLARAGVSRAERRLRMRLSLPAKATSSERLLHVRELLARHTFVIMPTVFGYAVGGFLTLAIARRLIGPLADSAELSTVLRGLPHNVTTEMDLDLWDLASRIRSDPDASSAFLALDTAELTRRYRTRRLPPMAQRGLAGFLRRYGHRAVGEIDLGLPRWSEEPGHIVSVIGNYLRLNDPGLAPAAQFGAGAATAEAMITELTDRVGAGHPVRARLVGWLLRRTRDLTGLRESPKFLLVLALSAMRNQLRWIGEELAAAGAVTESADVFFLDFDEIERALSGRSMTDLVAERRAAYEVELGRRHIPRVLLSDGTEPEAVAGLVERPDGALAGSPASPGSVTGPARVVLDPVGARLEPGEILVAPSTDPGWTPLFLTAGGLVMEMGGSNSHGAVVAREYGIPAVVGVADATHKIETGQLITVDGASGLVSLAQADVPDLVEASDI